MTARGLILGVLAGLALWAALILAGWGACQAAGSPTVGAQTVSDRAAHHLTTILGVPVPARRVRVTEIMWHSSSEGEVWPDALGEYRLRPATARLVANPETFLVAGHPTHPGLQVVIHELLHRDATVPCWRGHPDDFGAEEGIVDAVTADVGPSVAYRLWRVRGVRFLPGYPVEVAAVRAASARATGSRSWRTHAARAWRYRLWREDCAGRRALLEDAARA